ncbi:hypothetical protein [Pseudarthrobacter oxydans]|uniref:hypothetical protein n=1 Tax=Pseudarthrobacter oxydans TaxID=1671 RepID=UPI002AA8A645|nr:hypothetical protein [Pseudarthrobacter oxydans]WPU08101.1 hypothetical protein SMD14_13100 [Pseudarthrobacter oxydans]
MVFLEVENDVSAPFGLYEPTGFHQLGKAPGRVGNITAPLRLDLAQIPVPGLKP